MTKARVPNAPEATPLLDELFTALDARTGVQGGAADESAKEISTILDSLAEVMTPDSVELADDTMPPRRVAVAMALAVYSQPHLVVTFRRRGQPGVTPLTPSMEVLSSALGIHQWELDELRDEVDRRVGRGLKQARALHFLWTRFGLPEASPEPLFRVLHPGAPSQLGQIGMIRRGPQLYAVVSQTHPPSPTALFLSWIQSEDALSPAATIQGAYVDRSLRRAMARGLGGDEDEMGRLIDGMVSIVPKEGANTFLDLDEWRASAYARITNLGHPYGTASWLTQPLSPNDLDWATFLVDGSRLRPRHLRASFDELVVPRLQAMVRQLYAEILARVPVEDGGAEQQQRDVETFDLDHHIRAVMQPLMDWANAEATVVAVQNGTDASEADVRVALGDVADIWSNQLKTRWCQGGETPGLSRILAAHLATTQASLRRLYAQEPDGLFDHRHPMLLFAAHYFAEAPVERLWDPAVALDAGDGGEGGELPPIEDVVGQWFETVWQRLLDALRPPEDVPATFPPGALEDEDDDEPAEPTAEIP